MTLDNNESTNASCVDSYATCIRSYAARLHTIVCMQPACSQAAGIRNVNPALDILPVSLYVVCTFVCSLFYI